MHDATDPSDKSTRARKSSRRRVLGWTAGGGAALAGAALAGSSSSRVAAQAGQQIQGSWTVNVTPADGNPFQLFATFTLDGAVLISTPFVGQFSTAHGEWVSAGNGQFTVTAMSHFLVRPVEPGGPPTQTLTAELHATLTLNRTSDAFTAQYDVELYDASGNNVQTDVGTAQGTRIQVRPPQ